MTLRFAARGLPTLISRNDASRERALHQGRAQRRPMTAAAARRRGDREREHGSYGRAGEPAA
jgi:hypothetical protein